MDQRSKTDISLKKRYSDTVQYGEHRTDRDSWFINEFLLKRAFFNIHDIFKTGTRSSQVFLTTQVNSAEGPGRVSGELLDALERDLNVVAPKRRVRRVFNDNAESVQQSRGRFQALSSDEELARGELPTQVDRESSVFDMTVADSPDEDEDRVVQPVDVPRGRRVVLIPLVVHSTVSAQHV